MASITVQCPISGCEFTTGEFPEAVAVALLTTHAISHSISHSTPPANNVMARSRGPKLDRPKVKFGISLEDWNMFERRWNVFRAGSGIDAELAAPQLLQCADDMLGDAVLKVDPEITSQSLEIVIATMKELAVIPAATGVLRSELLDMKQKRDEQWGVSIYIQG